MFLKTFIVFALCIGCRYTEANCGPCEEPPKHYQELQCTGLMASNGDCCNTKYICPEAPFKPYTDKCHLNGTFYGISERVPKALVPSCTSESICQNTPNGSLFVCSHIEPVPVEENCLPQYSLESTCNPVKIVCGEEDKNKLAKCFYRGTEYYEGQLFTPKVGPYYSSACTQCVCNEHFDNSTLPQYNLKSCRKFDCGIELFNSAKLRRGCVPVYHSDGGDKSSCCPIDWICPENNSITTYLPNTQPRDLTCSFGDKTIKHREEMETDNKCRTCTCSLPPVLTCIEKANC